MSKDFKNKKSDYLLELALEEQLEQDVDMKKYKSDAEMDNPHVFSEEHNKRMQKLFKMAEKEEQRPKRFSRYRQMAAGFAAILCLSIFSVTQVEAFRLPVVRFFMDIKEKSTLFGASEEDLIGLTENYKEHEPQYVPDGFSVLKVEEGKGTFCIKYLNDQKNQTYMYYFFDSMENTAVDTEDVDTVELEINGNRAYVVQKEQEIRILMDKNDNRLYLDGTIPYEEAVKIMESVK